MKKSTYNILTHIPIARTITKTVVDLGPEWYGSLSGKVLWDSDIGKALLQYAKEHPYEQITKQLVKRISSNINKP